MVKLLGRAARLFGGLSVNVLAVRDSHDENE
jgi:hypothetical protein